MQKNSSIKSRGLTWPLIIACLSILAIDSVVGLTLSSFLFSTQKIDVSIGVTEALVAVSACCSIIYVFLHLTAILHLRHFSEHKGYQKDGLQCTLETFCFVLIRLLIVVWFGASSVGVSIAFNQATCRLASSADGQPWQKGLSCVLHRISVAVAIVALLSVCTLLISMELAPNAFNLLASSEDEESSSCHHDALSRENLLRHSSMNSLPESIDSDATIQVQKRPDVEADSRSSSWGSSWTKYISPSPVSSVESSSNNNTRNPSPSISDCTLQSSTRSSRKSSIRKHSLKSASSSMRSTYRRSLLSSMRRAESPDTVVVPEILRPARRRLPSGWMSPEDVKAPESVVVARPKSSDTDEAQVALLEELATKFNTRDGTSISVSEIDSQSEAGRLDSPRKTITLARSKAVSGVHRLNNSPLRVKTARVRSNR